MSSSQGFTFPSLMKSCVFVKTEVVFAVVWEGLGEKFLCIYPKLKVLSVENSVMDLSGGFSVLTSPSMSSGDECITSP